MCTGSRVGVCSQTLASGVALPLPRSYSVSLSATVGGLPFSDCSAAKRPASLTAVTGPQ